MFSPMPSQQNDRNPFHLTFAQRAGRLSPWCGKVHVAGMRKHLGIIQTTTANDADFMKHDMLHAGTFSRSRDLIRKNCGRQRK